MAWPCDCSHRGSREQVALGICLHMWCSIRLQMHRPTSSVIATCLRRRLGLARILMAKLEEVTDRLHRAFFVDLFVRAGNPAAITMYEKVGPRFTCWRGIDWALWRSGPMCGSKTSLVKVRCCCA